MFFLKKKKKATTWLKVTLHTFTHYMAEGSEPSRPYDMWFFSELLPQNWEPTLV